MSANLVSRMIPAQPGWFVIFGDRGDVFVGEQVIAWLIDESPPYLPDAITTMGLVSEHVVGFLRPDGKVEADGGSLYDSFNEYCAGRNGGAQ